MWRLCTVRESRLLLSEIEMLYATAPVFVSLYSVESKHQVWINLNHLISFEPLGKGDRSILYISGRASYLVVAETTDEIISLLGLKKVEDDDEDDDDEDLRRRLSGESYFDTNGERTK